jgi:hypothetical protein
MEFLLSKRIVGGIIMKKAWLYSGLILSTGIVLAGCGNEKQAMGHNNMQGAGKPTVDVTVDIPAKTMDEDAVVFKASAVEKKQPVNLEDVTFEVWEAGKQDGAHQKFKATLKKTGFYQAEAKLAEGEYEGLYHSNDKKGLHHMDNISLVVMDHSHEKEEASHEHEAVHGLSVNYMGATKVKAGADLPVSFHVFLDGNRLKANVQVEVIETGIEKHNYVPLTKKGDAYSGKVTLNASGQTTVRLHVGNDQLHHPEDELITVTK